MDEQKIDEYRSINELIHFQKNYSVIRQQIISDHKLLVEQEKNSLNNEIVQLEHSIETKKGEVEQQLLLELDKLNHQLDNQPSAHSNIIQTLIIYVKKKNLKLKIRNRKLTFDLKIAHSLKYLTENYNIKKNRSQYINSCFEDVVMESSMPQLQELDRKKRIIDQVNNSIYGALGEQKVVRELEKLSDDYILINDFKSRFNPPIYNRKEDDHIQSIQIDHILISPSGVFLIETKNWSQDSLNNLSLHSPVQQIKRTNFALYNILNGKNSRGRLTLNKHHWGDREIPIKNLIVLINNRPIEEFQYVKILTLNSLLGYVNYFKPCFSADETQKIANYLLNFMRK
ncbi:MAG: nuclease-related domain-containing protein [Bacteroidia bacterium]